MTNNIKLTLNEKLFFIQQELICNKDLKNTFGKYNYRSAETILEALKPLLEKYRCFIKLDDNIVFLEGEDYTKIVTDEHKSQENKISGRFYLKAIATIYDTDSKDFIQATAYAREPLTKKGMDESQITGAASSYARKYALSGLFGINDSDNDPDKTNGLEYITEKQYDTLSAICKNKQMSKEEVQKITKCETLRLVPKNKYKQIYDELSK